MADASFVRELVTGHAGSGKSTELLRLANQLRKIKDTQSFHVVYVDAFEYLSPWGLRLPQIIVALLAALSVEPRTDLRSTRAAKPLFERIKDVALSASKDVAQGIDTLAKLPLLTTLLKQSQSFSTTFREHAGNQIQDLLRLLAELIEEVSSTLQVSIVFIIDNLEKIPEQSTAEYASLHEALFVRDLPLLDIPAHIVITHPISLNYYNVELLRVFPNASKTTLPMVGIRQPPRADRSDDAAGIESLRNLILRRVSPSVFASDDVLEKVIRSSGGCVRDLVRFVGELPVVGTPPFTLSHVDDAIQEFKNDYEKILIGKPYVRYLPEIDSSGMIPEDLTPEWKREILLGLVVLEYDTHIWYDVHPLVKLTRSFMAARNG